MPLTINTKKCFREHGGNWIEYLGGDVEKHGEYVQRIGNLTLLAAELNIPASNNPFEAKQVFYEKSDIRITKMLCELENFHIEDIERRTNQLAVKATEIWSL
jgi:hypothetical protein